MGRNEARLHQQFNRNLELLQRLRLQQQRLRALQGKNDPV
jgi:hypothetical protein